MIMTHVFAPQGRGETELNALSAYVPENVVVNNEDSLSANIW